MLLVAAGLAVSAAPAGAADFTWTGAAVQPSWSLPANWGAAAPSEPVDTLRFPALTSPACASSPSTVACYVSTNNLATGLAVGGIELAGGTPYVLSGNAITLGAGGIAVSAPPAGEPASARIGMPIALDAPQTWSMEAGSVDHDLLVTGGVTAAPSTSLAAQLGLGTYLVLLSDAAVGPVTVTGDGALTLGFPPQAQGRLNATNGQPVSVTGGGSLLALDGVSGRLVTDAGAVQLGQFDRAGKLTVNGEVTLDSAGTLVAFVNRAGPEPGSDYSQLRATGDVSLAGSALILAGGVDPDTQACPQLVVGDELTIVETTDGTITGTFAGVPNGATVALACIGASGVPPTARINYPDTTVTATVLTAATPPAPTTTALAVSHTSPVTNEPITLTATVSAQAGTPVGTVRFERGGALISGCAGRPLSGGVATCQTSLAAAGSPHQLTARFTPAPASSLASSTSPASSVTVTPAATTAVVSFPVSTIGLNQPILLTAIVTAAHAGPARPQGLVDYYINGVASDGCSGAELIPQESSSVTQCELTYFGGGAGSQTDQISVRYRGDASFSGSTSPDRPLTIVLSQPSPRLSPPLVAPAPPVSVSTIPPPATSAGGPVARPVGRASTGRAHVRGTSVDVPVACAGVRGRSCRITLETTTLVIRRGGRVLSVRPAQAGATTTRRTLTVAATRSVTLAAGSRRTIRYKLSAAAARLLAGRRQLSVTMLVTQRTASGGSRNVSRQVLRFKAAAKTKRKA